MSPVGTGDGDAGGDVGHMGEYRSAALGAVAWLSASAGVAYLGLMLARQSITSMDFRYLWLAGEMWSQHQNPYSPSYMAAGAARFPDGYAIAGWVYPFHWYVPARLAAALPPAPAFALCLVVMT